MTPNDVKMWLDHLATVGITFLVDGKAAEVAVVDQVKGLTAPCAWIEGGRHPTGWSAVWLAGTVPGDLAHPVGWTPSHSTDLIRVPTEDAAARFLPVTTSDRLDVFLDFQTGKEMYLGRVSDGPLFQGGTDQATGSIRNEVRPEARKSLKSHPDVPYEVYSRVAENALRTFIGELLATAFGYWLAGVWRLGAQALFWLFAGLSALEALHLLSVAGAGTVGWALLKREGATIENGEWLRRATFVRLGALVVSTALLYVLYRRIW